MEDKIRQYDATVQELKLLDEEIESGPVREEISRIRKRLAERKRGRVIFIHIGKRELIFPVRYLRGNLFDMLTNMLLLAIEQIQKKVTARPEPGADEEKTSGSG